MNSKVFLFSHSKELIKDFENDKQMNLDEILTPEPSVDLQFPTEGYGDTKINKVNELVTENIIEYECIHDFKQTTKGKVFNLNFNYYFITNKFNSYYYKNDCLFVVNTSTDPAIDFLNVLNNENDSKVNIFNVDMEQLMKKLENVSGIWVSDIKTQNLSASGMYGYQVDKSTEFARIKEKGRVSYITFNENEIYNKPLSIGITQNAAIIISNKLDKIEDGKQLAKEIFNRYLADIVKVEEA